MPIFFKEYGKDTTRTYVLFVHGLEHHLQSLLELSALPNFAHHNPVALEQLLSTSRVLFYRHRSDMPKSGFAWSFTERIMMNLIF